MVGSSVLTWTLSGGSGTPAWGPSGLRGWALVTVGVWGGGASPPSEGGRDLRTTGFVADLLSPAKLSARAAHTLPPSPSPQSASAPARPSYPRRTPPLAQEPAEESRGGPLPGRPCDCLLKQVMAGIGVLVPFPHISSAPAVL